MPSSHLVRPSPGALICALLCSLLGAACAKEHHGELAPTDAGAPIDAGTPVFDLSLVETLALDGKVSALVTFDEEYAQRAYGSGARAGARASFDGRVVNVPSQADALQEAKVVLYRRIVDEIERRTSPLGVEVRTRYEQLPVLHVILHTRAALLELSAMPEVAHVFEDRKQEAFLSESLALIEQPSAAQAFYTGEGTSVAVLDTGCDFTRPAFGSCASAGAAGCKVAYAADFATADGSRDDVGHGTNVSAIVLGVAPDTKVLALDVFNGGSSSSSIILQAIDWSIQQRATYNIVAMNLSLGGGLYTSSCTGDVFAGALANARAVGIVPVVASGNNAATNAIASPACVPAALSVGAVYDRNLGGMNFPAAGCSDSSTQADKVACFSNSSANLTMLAPGAMITAAGLSQTGTSQAAPHVAGAVAVVRAAHPNESIDESVARLTTTGPSITDARNGLVRRRLDMAAALESGPADLVAPTGTVSINAGASATGSTAVSLTLSATDAVGVASMCISNAATCTAFVTYAQTASWTLASGAGTKTVKVWFKDTSGNVGTATDTILLDTTKPADGAVAATGGDANVAMTFSGFSDAASGVAGYRVVFAPNSSPANCSAGTQVYSGASASFAHSGLTNGAVYGYRACAVDAAGNVSLGRAFSVRPAPEYVAPTGSVSINAGAAYARSTKSTLTLSGSDTSGVTAMCISNTTACTTWINYATSLPWTLGKSAGASTVYVWFRDRYGNAMTTPVSDATFVDSALPTVSTLTATGGNARVDLAFAATDTGSGVASYVVRSAATTAPASCDEGSLVYSGSATSFRHDNLVNGNVYGYRVCALDAAGNRATGKVMTARPAPEFNAPTGSVVINGAAAYTNNRTVSLALSATDASGVSAMCVSGTATCSAWQNYASTSTFTLSKSSGTAVVNVWFRDLYGNASATPVTDSITIDTTAPTMGALSGAASSGTANLSWLAATDAGSGLASYKLVWSATVAPASCAAGTQAFQGLATSRSVSGLPAGKVGFRLCATDALGNAAVGKTLVLTIP